MIRLVIFDGDGTLGLPSPSDDIRELVSYLKDRRIAVGVATNQYSETEVQHRFAQAGLLAPDCIATRRQIGQRKPAPAFVTYLRAEAGAELHETLYVGDDDDTDMLCAINARVLPIAALYSAGSSKMQYGLPLSSPQDLLEFIDLFGRQPEPYFGWTCQDFRSGLDMRVLLYEHSNITGVIKAVLKRDSDVTAGRRAKRPVARILFDYLLSQCYLSGLLMDVDYIAVYPGHLANSQSANLLHYAGLLQKMFKERFVHNLIQRHSDAPESKTQGNERDIQDQIRTIRVDPTMRGLLSGKRILVLDDFSTCGYSLETARIMLLKAGAKSVTGVAIAKFRNNHTRCAFRENWNPFEPCPLTPNDYTTTSILGTSHKEADDYFFGHIWDHYTCG